LAAIFESVAAPYGDIKCFEQCRDSHLVCRHRMRFLKHIEPSRDRQEAVANH
jgi:hypothetical protein